MNRLLRPFLRQVVDHEDLGETFRDKKRHVYRISVGGFNSVRSQKSSSLMEHRNHKIEVKMSFFV